MFGANVEYRIQNTEKRAGGLARSQRRSRWGEGKVHVCTCIHVARGTPDSLYSYVVGLQRRLRDCHPFETVVPAPLCWGKAGQGRQAGRQRGSLFVVLFECRPKTILYHVEDSSAIVVVIYNLQRAR